MIKRIMLFSITMFFILTTLYSREDISLMRFPNISPDGNTITFSYCGDIWISSIDGGEAHRVTIHIADDTRPVFSPDGKTIAFSSRRKGNYDVYTIPVKGGNPTQLTFRSTGDWVTDWTPDGEFVVFFSSRDQHFYYGSNETYKISISGGMPHLLIPQMAKNCKFSKDNDLIAFNINHMPEFRQRYRGAANNDIYTYQFSAQSYKQLTKHLGNDKWPSIVKNNIFYVSDKDNTFNIWKMDLNGGNKIQLTFHQGDQVRYPTVSPNGKTIIYEYLDKLYRWDEGKDPYSLKIDASSDEKTNHVITKFYQSDATEMAVSPDGELIAFVVRGEIFLNKKDWDRTKNITNNSFREMNISWSPDGKSLLFTSDRSGNFDLFIISSANDKDLYHTYDYNIINLTQSSEEEHSGYFSNKGDKIAYIEGKGNLVVFDKNGQNKRYLCKGWNMDSDFQWSPDDQYIAFSRWDKYFNQDIYIYVFDQNKYYNVSKHPDDDHMPKWSPNGRFLYFLSKRKDNNFDIWRLSLKKQWHDMTDEEWHLFTEMEEKNNKSKDDQSAPQKISPITIDFQDIHLRLTHLTHLLGEEMQFVVTGDSKNIIFTAQNDEGAGLYSIGWNKKNKRTLMGKISYPKSLNIGTEKKDTYCYYISNGQLFKMKFINGTANQNLSAKNIAFNGRLEIDRLKENSQKFNEAWRLLNEYFYDPEFHGADWKGLYKKYRPWALQTCTAFDFNYVFSMLLGELNASHLGIFHPDRYNRKLKKMKTGLIGVMFDTDFNGVGFKVKKVLRNSPADRFQCKLYKGDIITAINNMPVKKNDNYYQMMEDRDNEKILFDVVRVAEKQKKVLKIEIVPVSYQYDSVYDTWVHENQLKVEKMTKGKLAYLHIENMGKQNLDKFEDELYSIAYGKEGLIIDVRYNGGGWITDYLLQILMVRQHAVTIPRDGEKGYPHSRRSIFSWSKPIVVLINQQSYSNAEIFPWSIRTLKRGPIVGKQTFGAVISTNDTRLIDGSRFRMPFRGWYVNDGTMTNQELNGCPPDFPVENLPGEELTGKDRQLEKAVEVLMKEVEKNKTDNIWKG